MRPLSEQILLITGATDGLGRALARNPAGRGMTVLAHGRDEARGQVVVRARPAGAAVPRRPGLPRGGPGNGGGGQGRVDRLDALVSTDGTGREVPGGPDRQESADGDELRFAVGHLAGHLLTRELLPLLRAAGEARIVSVSSAAQIGRWFDGLRGTRAHEQAYDAAARTELRRLSDELVG
jgi:NAD(P)-dependent dehydrogenase (short-subunit alcohol dehydrogenase family)